MATNKSSLVGNSNYGNNILGGNMLTHSGCYFVPSKALEVGGEMKTVTVFWIGITLVNTVSVLVTILKWLGVDPPPVWVMILLIMPFIVGVCFIIVGTILYLQEHLRWVNET